MVFMPRRSPWRNLGTGINFYLVGLPDSAVPESHKRIVAALRNCKFNNPRHEITVNMAPAGYPQGRFCPTRRSHWGSWLAPAQVNQERLGEYVIMGSCHLMEASSRSRAACAGAIQAQRGGI